MGFAFPEEFCGEGKDELFRRPTSPKPRQALNYRSWSNRQECLIVLPTETRNTGKTLTDNWHSICDVAAFPEEGMLAASAGGWEVLIVKDGDAYFAYNDCCTHQASRLSTGRVRRGTIMCPLHGARFKIGTGACLGGGYPSLRAFPLRIEGEEIQIEVPDTPPGPGELPVASP